MSRLASITQDLADLYAALRQPGHPQGATEAYADEIRTWRQPPAAAGRVPAARVALAAERTHTIRRLNHRAVARARVWLGIDPAPTSKES